MYSHEPPSYECPFCKIVQGGEDQYTQQQDIVLKDESVTAFISPKWWKNNPGHVIVIPNEHVENIYSIGEPQLSAVHIAAKKVALAMKRAYKCDGTSIRQHNEPAGDQDLWHFHVHVFPRYPDDRLYHEHDKAEFVDSATRLKFATMLRDSLDVA